MPPTMANGKICYMEMPATDIARSADFYKSVFGWNIRKRGVSALSRPTPPQPHFWLILLGIAGLRDLGPVHYSCLPF